MNTSISQAPITRRRLYWLAAALALGVAAMAAIGGLTAGLKAGIGGTPQARLGGDVALSSDKPLPFLALAWLQFHSAAVSLSMDAPAVAESGGRHVPVALKGVDAHYPLYGKLVLTPQVEYPFFDSHRLKLHGAAVDRSLMQKLHLAVGQYFTIGRVLFEITAAIDSEPDRSADGRSSAPRVMVSLDGFRAARLDVVEGRSHFHYNVLLQENGNLAAWERDLAAQFPDARWRMRDWHAVAAKEQAWLGRLWLAFILTGIATLTEAVTVRGRSAERYMTLPPAAFWRIGIAAVAYGLIIGALSGILLARLATSLLPAPAIGGVYAVPVALSAAFGLLALWAASLPSRRHD